MAVSESASRAHKFFLLLNYGVLGASASSVFLSLSLRLLPSPVGILLILLHLLTIALSVSSSSLSSPSPRAHAAHMAATVLLAILQGAVSLLIFSETSEFLLKMKSYVREEEGVKILRMVGGLGAVVFCLEWVVLVVAFVMRFYVCVEKVSPAKVGNGQEGRKDWLPFQVV